MTWRWAASTSAQWDLGEYQKSQNSAEEAVSILRRLARRNSVEYEVSLSSVLIYYARSSAKLGQSEQAKAASEEAVKITRQKPGHPGGGRIRERIRGAARWTAGVSWFVVLRLPGLAGCGMMARAARDAGVSLGYEPVQKPGAGTLTRRVASCCLEHAGQTSRSRTDLGPRAAR